VVVNARLAMLLAGFDFAPAWMGTWKGKLLKAAL